MPAAPAEQQVGVDAVGHRDGGHRYAGLQAALHKFALELLAVSAAPPSGAYDWSGHDVHYRGLMHTIAGVPNPLIVLIHPQPGKRAFRPRLLSGKTKRCANRAAQALKLAAAALRSSKSALGAYFRRMCSHMDKPKAVTAAAHKLARLIYTLLTKGEEYTDQGQDYFEERYRERVIRQITLRAAKLGLSVVPTAQAA